MVIDESNRHAMYTRLQEVLGKEHARVLMEHLPPVGWADVATKHDLEGLRVAMKRDVGSVRTELKNDMRALRTELKNDIGALGTELKNDIGALRSDTKRDLEILENRLLATFRAELNSQTRTMIYAQSASMLMVAGMAFGAARLI